MTKLSTLLQRAELRKKYENSLTKCSKCSKPLICKENLLVLRAGIGIDTKPEINGSEALTLQQLGFCPIGIRAKSRAAYWQSWLGNVASGSLFATLQSLGAKGLNTLFFGGTDAALTLLSTVSLKLNWCTGKCKGSKNGLKELIEIEKKSTMKFDVIGQSEAKRSPVTLRMTINDVARLMFLQSPELKLGNSTWTIKVFRNNPNYLGISFMGNRACKLIIMISVLGINKPIKKTYIKNTKAAESFMINEFALWDGLFRHENGFIHNDSITMEIKIRINASMTPLRLVCFVCFEGIKRQEISSLSCGHLFCSKCVRGWLNEKKYCPTCHLPALLSDLRRTILPV